MSPPQNFHVPAGSEDSALLHEQFVRTQSVIRASPLVPEIVLHVAREPYGIWQSAETAAGTLPYWAFAWPGGLALARYVLDNPHAIAGRSVLDLGCGSAIAGIAAMKAGAASCIGADIDGLALAAARLNAKAAGVVISTTAQDLLSSSPIGCNVILVGDLAYEPLLADRMAQYLLAAAEDGARVLFGDRTATPSRLARGPWLAEYKASVFPAL